MAHEHSRRPPGGLPSPITHRVAIVHTPDPQEAWDFCRGVAGYFPRSGVWGLRSIPLQSPSSPTYLRRLGQTVCDGLIMAPGRRRTLLPLHQRGVKVVEVEGDGGDAPYVRLRLDDRYIGRLAGEHLLERGFTRIAYLGDTSTWSRDRADGLRHVVESAGGTCHRSLTRDWMQLTSATWILRQLRPIARPLAVLGCDDLVAAAVVRAVAAAGWRIPAEVGVMGVDDRISECIGVQPPLTSISMERLRMGHEAARLLDLQFLGKGEPGRLHLLRPQRVIERESTSAYAYEDPDIAAAVAFIHREACNGITIDDVVGNVSLARRTLERRFAEVVGRSPGDEIRRVRLEAVKRALEGTHLPLADIAARCGFSCLSALSHSFRLATGLSPRAWRNRTRPPDGKPPDGLGG